MNVRRYLIPWLSFVLPTLAVGALALTLLAREQERLNALAQIAARERVQTVADNLDLVMAEIKTGVMQALQAASGPGDERARMEELVATNPFVERYTIQAPSHPARGGADGNMPISFGHDRILQPFLPPDAASELQRPLRRHHAARQTEADSDKNNHGEAQLRRQNIRNIAQQNIQALTLLKADEMEKSYAGRPLPEKEATTAASRQSEPRNPPEDWIMHRPEGRSGWVERGDGAPGWLGWYQRMPARRVAVVFLKSQAVMEQLLGTLPADGSLYLITPNGEIFPPQESAAAAGAQNANDFAASFAKAPDAATITLPVGPELPGWHLRIDADVLALGDNRSFLLLGSLLVAALCAATLGSGTLLLLQAQRDAREAVRKATFVSNVSHELRTPLTTIRMYAEMLQDEHLSDKGKRKRYLATIHTETVRLSRLVDRVLDFNRLEREGLNSRLDCIDISALIQTTLEVQAPRLGLAHMEIRWQPPSAPLYVTGDADALEQILLNLTDNAIKYAAAGELLAIELRVAGQNCELRIKDHGPGIPAKDRQRIFRPFERLDESLSRSSEGSGLGLAICQALVQDMNGQIRVEPTDGKTGCTVVITLLLYTRT